MTLLTAASGILATDGDVVVAVAVSVTY